MQTAIRGIFNILATPFDPEGRVDIDSLNNLVDFQIDLGAHGLTILGVLGEAAKLTVEERQLVMDTVMETVNRRVPVVVGSSHADTPTCIRLSREAVAAGAAGVMIAPPRMAAPTDAALLALYRGIAAAVDCPIVVQDFPPVNGVIMSPDFLADLAEKVPAARHLKLEDPPLMQKIEAIRQRTKRFEIFGGLGGMFLIEELKRGCSGTMTGFAFTEILVAVFDAVFRWAPGRCRGHLRPLPAADPLRESAGDQPGHPQGTAQTPRRHCLCGPEGALRAHRRGHPYRDRLGIAAGRH